MPHAEPTLVDPRGLRLAAALTSGVLAVALVTGSVWVLAIQAAVFALGAVGGVRRSPYAMIYVRLVRPRLGAPAYLEDPRPPRFAQAFGLVFTLVALTGFAGGAPAVGLAATGVALAAALLNAVFGLCLGCEAYLLIRRAVHRPAGRVITSTDTSSQTRPARARVGTSEEVSA